MHKRLAGNAVETEADQAGETLSGGTVDNHGRDKAKILIFGLAGIIFGVEKE
jgi:hypothetical protein